MASNVTRDHHNLRRNLKLNGNYISNDGGDEGISIADNGDVTVGSLITNNISPAGTITIDAAGDIKLDAAADDIKFVRSGDLFGLFNSESTGSTTSLTIFEEGGGGSGSADFCKILVEEHGATTISTVDDNADAAHLTLAPDGDCIIDRNVANTSAGTYTGLSIDYDKTGASTSDNTLYGLNIDMDNTTATNGTNTMYGIYCTPRLQHTSDDAGTPTVIGGYFKAISNAYGTSTGVGMRIDMAIADTSYGLQIRAVADTDDFFTIKVAANGATTLSTVDAGSAVGHLNIEPDGHVEFDNCAVGFDRLEATFSTTAVIESGGSDDTDIDFRLSNKYRLEMTDDIAQMNLIFPNTSGNFLLVCYIGGGGGGDFDVTAWKVWEHDSAAGATNAAGTTDVMWAGGSVPAFTTGASTDIVSFYWDADEQQCYGVASLAFATP